MHRFDHTVDSASTLLSEVSPTDVVYALEGPAESQLQLLKVIVEYCRAKDARLLFLSSVAVFDAVRSHASYENDKPIPQSSFGKYKTQAEKIVDDLPADLFSILRLPLIIGTNAPTIKQLRQAHRHQAHFEVFPNHIISVISDIELVRQVHYIVNQKLSGIYHISSTDLIHHSDLFLELSQKLGLKNTIFEYNYSSNEDEYRALLPKQRPLPGQFAVTVAQLINQVVLNQEISTLKVDNS